jgi:hypothetical protein
MPLAIVSAPSGTVLSFCQPFNGESSVVGEIELTADSTVSAVRWGFFAKETANEMGGVAYFDPPARTTSRAHLLPRSSTVWVRLQKSNMFEITEYAFGRWSVAELGESVREVPPGGG